MKIASYVFMLVVGFVWGFVLREHRHTAEIRQIESVAYDYYEHRLADPHHCVSVCEKQFEKMGC